MSIIAETMFSSRGRAFVEPPTISFFWSLVIWRLGMVSIYPVEQEESPTVWVFANSPRPQRPQAVRPLGSSKPLPQVVRPTKPVMFPLKTGQIPDIFPHRKLGPSPRLSFYLALQTMWKHAKMQNYCSVLTLEAMCLHAPTLYLGNQLARISARTHSLRQTQRFKANQNTVPQSQPKEFWPRRATRSVHN